MCVVSMYYYRAEQNYYFMVPEKDLENFLFNVGFNVGVEHDEPFVNALNPAGVYGIPGQVVNYG